MGVNLKNNNEDIKSISPGQEEFLKNRKKKSKAIAIILFLNAKNDQRIFSFSFLKLHIFAKS